MKKCVTHYYDKRNDVAQKWFTHFSSGNSDVKEESNSSRPITQNADELLEKVQQDKHISSIDIGDRY